MRRRIVVLWALAACHSEPGGQPADAYTACPAPSYPRCSSTCGNGAIDHCTLHDVGGETNPPCGRDTIEIEACDGDALGQTCDQLGFYGGTPTCDVGCRLTTTSCVACAPGTAACHTLGVDGDASAIAYSNGRFAVATSVQVIEILDASLAHVASSPMAGQPIHGLVPVADGWLAISTLAVRHVSTDGAIGDPVPIIGTAFAAGPGGNVMAIAIDTVNDRISGVIIDAAGGTVVPTFTVLAHPDPNGIAIAGDASSFFVASGTQLVRIAGDGTVSTGGTLGADAVVAVVWDGTSGWVVSRRDLNYLHFDAQRFAATGALVGEQVAIDLPAVPSAWLTRNDVLYAVDSTGMKERLLGFAGDGTPLPSVELGLGDDTVAVTTTPTSFAFAWYVTPRTRVALLAP